MTYLYDQLDVYLSFIAVVIYICIIFPQKNISIFPTTIPWLLKAVIGIIGWGMPCNPGSQWKNNHYPPEV